MEELNKTQLVLLAIFITLVTSTATGVIVVTLMDQAPQGITQTINRVVERTVETVVSPGKIEKTEVTQIVREDDSIIASIKKTKQSLVRIVKEDVSMVTTDVTPSVFGSQQVSLNETLQENSSSQVATVISSIGGGLALADKSQIGFIVSSDGLVVSSNKITLDGTGKYYAIFSNETKVPVTLIRSDDTHGIAIFKINNSGLKEKINIVPLTTRSYDQVSLGQTVVAVDFEDSANTVSMGYVSALKAGNASSTPVIKISIKPTDNWSGRPIIDANGFLIGVYGLNNEIVPYPLIKSLIDSSL